MRDNEFLDQEDFNNNEEQTSRINVCWEVE